MPFLSPLAAFLGPETLALMIPITALLIPIVAVLTKHQQRMAEIVHQNRMNPVTDEIQAMREEMRGLRELVHQQTIAIDTLSRPPLTTPPPTDEIQNRLGQ